MVIAAPASAASTSPRTSSSPIAGSRRPCPISTGVSRSHSTITAARPASAASTDSARTMATGWPSYRIRYEGQPVAIVLAESVEAAEAGRAAVIVECERETPVLIGHGRREPAMGEDEVRGDVDAALAGAAITIEQTYLQAPRHHHAMETSGTVARWDGGRLTLWDAVQASSTVIPVVSAAFGLDAADVRVVAPHTGGGFGAKGYIWP